MIPGSHTISVTTFDTSGEPSHPAVVVIDIIAPEKTAVPTQTSTTPEGITAPQAVEISFWADQTQIQQGNCTNLNWNVQNASAVALEGGTVNSSGMQQVCPSQNKTYTLTASGASGKIQKSISINVSIPAPSDNDPPQISNVTHSPGKIWNYHTCGADTFSVSADASDASSISQVTLRFRVVKASETGAWVERTMSGSAGSFQLSIGPADLKQSLSGYRGKAEYQITAKDAHGNSSQSGIYQIEISECLI